MVPHHESGEAFHPEVDWDNKIQTGSGLDKPRYSAVLVEEALSPFCLLNHCYTVNYARVMPVFFPAWSARLHWLDFAPKFILWDLTHWWFHLDVNVIRQIGGSRLVVLLLSLQQRQHSDNMSRFKWRDGEIRELLYQESRLCDKEGFYHLGFTQGVPSHDYQLGSVNMPLVRCC